MEIYTEDKISEIVSHIKRENISMSEKLDLFVGPSTDKDRRLVIKPGLKIKHKKSGVVYTVQAIDLSDLSNPTLICNRPGFVMEITKQHFKDYERQ